jgi:hypothetical protein
MQYMRSARAHKEKLIAEELDKAKNRFTGRAENSQIMEYAIDNILARELIAAKKEGRPPMYNTRTIYDEVAKLNAPPILLIAY